MKIDTSPYLSEKSSDFHEIVYTAADYELDKRYVIRNEKSCIGQKTPSSTELISCFNSFEYARRGIQSATEMLSSFEKGDEGLSHCLDFRLPTPL